MVKKADDKRKKGMVRLDAEYSNDYYLLKIK